MRNTARSFTLATAAVFMVLFFGTAAPKALAQNDRPRGSAYGRFQAPQGNARTGRGDRQYRLERSDSRWSFDRRSDRRFDGRRYGDRFDERRFYGRSYGRGFGDRFENRPFVRRYRSVRVFIYDPFPHWVIRRVCVDPTDAFEPNFDPY
ncbi:MAG TPA: hypothetical protein VGS00_08485 [Thermoanaerobaculia bacterium]|nr:hypothetical protein [Thermoanaerobaculia bacterium]